MIFSVLSFLKMKISILKSIFENDPYIASYKINDVNPKRGIRTINICSRLPNKKPLANKSKMVLRIFYHLSIIRLKVAFSHHLDHLFLGCRCANRKDGHNKVPTVFEGVEKKNNGLLPPTSTTLFMQKLQAI